MQVRKARLHDATNIYELVNSLSPDGTLLRRPFAEICEKFVTSPSQKNRSGRLSRDVARCISTGRISPRCVPSSCAPRQKATG